MFDKRAPFGDLLPYVDVPPPSAATVALQKLAADDGPLGRLTQAVSAIAGRMLPGPQPSRNAFEVVCVLGQIRDPLCDQKSPTLQGVNDELDKVAGRGTDKQGNRRKKPQSIEDALQKLQAYPQLAQEFERQMEPLDSAGDFDAQRRARLVRLVALETAVLATVTD